jgi:hypothetical protein
LQADIQILAAKTLLHQQFAQRRKSGSTLCTAREDLVEPAEEVPSFETPSPIIEAMPQRSSRASTGTGAEEEAGGRSPTVELIDDM